MTAASLPLRRRTARFAASCDGPATLGYRSIYVLPTRNGLMFAGMLFVMWLGAVNYGNSMVFTFTFLLSSMALVATLHTFRNLRGLRASAVPPRPVFVGETATFPVLLENPGGAVRTAIGLQLKDDVHSLTDIPAAGGAMLALRVAARERGWLCPPRIRLFTIFPTGLFHAWSRLDLKERCLIYPRPEPAPVPLPLAGASDDGGTRSGRGQDDFYELRRYRPGDSPRHVAWRVVARGQEPRTKQFGGELLTPVWLDWEMPGRLDTEARLARLCRWVLDAESAQRSYGLRLPGVTIPIGRGREHRDRCLKALALFGP